LKPQFSPSIEKALPCRLPSPVGIPRKNKDRKERDEWKSYASDAAAAFVMGWIAPVAFG